MKIRLNDKRKSKEYGDFSLIIDNVVEYEENAADHKIYVKTHDGKVERYSLITYEVEEI